VAAEIHMINPFQYGGVVGEEAFCNRAKELDDLARAMENGERLFVYSERRVGKTSLIKLALDRLPSKKYLTAYVDLWPTDGEASFVAAMARAITQSLAGTADKMLQSARDFFGRLTPVVSADADGNPKVSFGISRHGSPLPELEEVLAAPARIAARRKCRVVIVFDEFQRILEYGGDLVERSLRSAIQHHGEVAYIFLGSRKHLIQKMFLDQTRPLYRAGGHYTLGPIGTEEWVPFVMERFIRSDRSVDPDLVRRICAITGGHPFYTQHLCHALWELCERGGSVTAPMIDGALDLLLERESHAYTSLWDSFALNQRRFLKGLAAEPEGVKVFSGDFVADHDLRSPSNVQRAVDALLERDVIDRDKGTFLIVDRFFRIWIDRTHPE